MSTLRRLAVFVGLALLIGGAFAYLKPFDRSTPGSDQQRQQRGARGRDTNAPVPVLVAASHAGDVPIYLDGVGTTKALNTVSVSSLVDGTLLSVDYQEGQDVKPGDVLARVDPVTYQAQLDQAIAKKALDEAQLANAKLDLVRYTNLVKTNAVTTQQLDTQKALVDQLEAQVKLDQGAIDNARAYVKWCTIISPIEGRTGIRQVDEGNVVHGAAGTVIVVVTTVRPIAVVFTLPQQQLSRVVKAFTKGPLTALAVDPDLGTQLDQGKLQVINNQVDQTTGTVQFKAEFPNKDLQLWPGQFVNIRLLVDTLQQVVVVPTAAVQRGPNGAFVYVAQPDSTVKVQAVTVSQQDETQTVITSGLQSAEQVVTSGFAQLANGKAVIIAKADETASPASAAAPRDRRADAVDAADHTGRPAERHHNRTSSDQSGGPDHSGRPERHRNQTSSAQSGGSP